MEIALKIASKIKANERFAAYIVVPMWPEGVPTGAATQRILFWQVGSDYKLCIKMVKALTVLFLLRIQQDLMCALKQVQHKLLLETDV